MKWDRFAFGYKWLGWVLVYFNALFCAIAARQGNQVWMALHGFAAVLCLLCLWLDRE